MLSALAPGYLRIGGTMADRLYFIRDSQPSFKIHYVSEIDGGVCSYESVNCNYLLRPNFTMSGNYECLYVFVDRYIGIFIITINTYYLHGFNSILPTNSV